MKDPIRRRILHLLSEKPRTFTEMLKFSGIESSHLTYLLESLGTPISKDKEGYYKLSTFVETAVSMMERGEEEVGKSEDILGGIRDAIVRRTYRLPEICDLFFTDKREIGAVVLSRKTTAGYNGLISGLHLGVLGWYLARRDRERCWKGFDGKKPHEMLILESDNFEIAYNDISSVSLHKGLMRATMEFELIREQEQEKVTFSYSSKQFSDAEKIFEKY